MNLTEAGLVAAVGLGVATSLATVACPAKVRPMVAGWGTAGCGLAGLLAGAGALDGHAAAAWLPDLLPLAGIRLQVDALGGLFLAVVGAVAACAGVYSVGYSRAGRVPQAVLPLFVVSMLLVPAAGSVSTLLAAWELMALTSLVLVLTEHRQRTEVATAGQWYAVMTHLSLVAILGGLVWFAAAAHDETFAGLRAAASGIPDATRSAIFIATLIGFAAKAGVVPLHVWLPRAHPEAPSHVSALMSAAMVSLGVYGIVRVGFDLLGGGPAWWWLTVMGLGGVSALYGILQAAVSTDLKRLLGYSTTENMGLVLIGVGAAGFFSASGAAVLAALALSAALLHVVNHAGFKTLLFCAAGSVVHATGTRDLDALGGLRARMPATTGLFAVGALCAAALPLGNGFVSEWLLLQSLVHALPTAGTASAVTMPVAVAVVALTAGLGVATFVKALGVGFLARPRTAAAARAHEGSPTMIAGMAVAAAVCATLAIAPGLVLPAVASSVEASGLADRAAVTGQVTLRLSGVTSTLAPALIAAALLLGLVVARLAMGRPARRSARLWDCGAGPMSARMEYTATSFAEPLQRVFDDVLGPEQDVHVTPHLESQYLIERVEYRRRVPDRIEKRIYAPVLAAAGFIGVRARVLANGSVHRYLGYGFFGFTALLIVLAVTR